MDQSCYGAFFGHNKKFIEKYFDTHTEQQKGIQKTLTINTTWSKPREINGNYTLHGNWKTLTFAKNAKLVIKAHSVLHLARLFIKGTPCIEADPTSKITLNNVIWYLAPNKEFVINTLEILNNSSLIQNKTPTQCPAILKINNIVIKSGKN
jgi:hypothetical protein